MKKIQMLLTIAVMAGLTAFVFSPSIFAMSPALLKWSNSHPALSQLSIIFLLLLSFVWMEINIRQSERSVT